MALAAPFRAECHPSMSERLRTQWTLIITAMRIVFFPSSSDFRRWLQAEGQKNPELWVGLYKKSSGKLTITYSEALDEALCFGWIDGVRKSIDADAYTVRFTPRKPKSQWSAVNIKRVQQLSLAGRMCPEGLKAFEGATGQSRKYSYEQRAKANFDPQDARRFRANRKAWDFFQSQPPWYRRTATFWVVSAKKVETRQRRFATLLGDSERGQLLKLLRRLSVSKRQRKSQ
jgi:uncharacterized protein YdeI (YjbR/CyaY-like superfamily)